MRSSLSLLSDKRLSHGFSLIEVMIGLVIGMIGLLVVYQVVTVWGGRAQTTTAGSDAQVSGTIAMYSLERDLSQAGFGFGVVPGFMNSDSGDQQQNTVIGCDVRISDPVAYHFRLAPVEINPPPFTAGAAGTPQQIGVFYGNSTLFTASQSFQTSTATTKSSKNGYAFQTNDYVLASHYTPSSARCDGGAGEQINALFKVSGNAITTPPAVISHTATDADGLTGTAFGAGLLFNLGPDPQRKIWQIDTSGNRPVLGWVNQLKAATTPAVTEVAEGIINLQAQYGYDQDGNQRIDSTEWRSTLPNNPDWTFIKAIRVSVLSRSKQYEKNYTATAQPNPSWAASGSCAVGACFLMTNLDGSDGAAAPTKDADNWRHYRYHVYEKVIPLRNMIWGAN